MSYDLDPLALGPTSSVSTVVQVEPPSPDNWTSILSPPASTIAVPFSAPAPVFAVGFVPVIVVAPAAVVALQVCAPAATLESRVTDAGTMVPSLLVPLTVILSTNPVEAPPATPVSTSNNENETLLTPPGWENAMVMSTYWPLLAKPPALTSSSKLFWAS